MLLPLEIQFDMVIYSFLAGVLVGILFDFYKIIRGVGVPKVITIIEDILFWIFCGLVIFTFLLKFNYAFLTTYVYVFLGIGIIIYLKTLSRRLFKVENAIAHGGVKGTRIVLKNIRYILKSIFTK